MLPGCRTMKRKDGLCVLPVLPQLQEQQLSLGAGLIFASSFRYQDATLEPRAFTRCSSSHAASRGPAPLPSVPPPEGKPRARHSFPLLPGRSRASKRR